jgi:hypothetical protein
MKNIELYTDKELINELKNRYYHLIITGIKKYTEKRLESIGCYKTEETYCKSKQKTKDLYKKALVKNMDCINCIHNNDESFCKDCYGKIDGLSVNPTEFEEKNKKAYYEKYRY